MLCFRDQFTILDNIVACYSPRIGHTRKIILLGIVISIKRRIVSDDGRLDGRLRRCRRFPCLSLHCAIVVAHYLFGHLTYPCCTSFGVHRDTTHKRITLSYDVAFVISYCN